MISRERTKEIYENVSHWQIPIIDMTANVSWTTREDCL